MSAGSPSAAVFRLTLSAPASTAAAASSSDRIPPPTASGMNSSRATTDRVGERAPRFDRRRDVEDHQLVDPFDVVAARQLRGVARGSKAFEVHPFDHVTVANVEARDDAF